MKVKLDENLSVSLLKIFSEFGCDAETVDGEGLSGANDATVFKHVQAEKRLLVTCDLDFADIRHYTPSREDGIMVLRLSDRSWTSVIKRIRQVLEEISLENLQGATTIVSDTDVRFRKPA